METNEPKSSIVCTESGFIIKLNRLPPSVNHAYYHIKKGKAFIKVKTKECKEFVKYVHGMFPTTYTEIQNDGVTNIKRDVKPIECDVSVNISVNYGDNRKRDLDNILKILIDSLIGKAYKDDSQIMNINVKRIKKTIFESKSASVNMTIKNLNRDAIIRKCAECGITHTKDELTWDTTKNHFVCNRCF